MGLILLIVSLILTSVVSVISVIVTPIYYIVTFKWRSGVKQLDKWLYKMALSIDQFGNVSCGTTLKFLMTKGKRYNFGDEDDTVSYVLGRNKYRETLTAFGRFIVWVLNLLDKDHVEKAIKMKIEADEKASLRYRYERYYGNKGKRI